MTPKHWTPKPDTAKTRLQALRLAEGYEVPWSRFSIGDQASASLLGFKVLVSMWVRGSRLSYGVWSTEFWGPWAFGVLRVLLGVTGMRG